MKAVKKQSRTFETIGYVQYRWNENIEQQPHDHQLPAFLSFVDGHLSVLRIAETEEILFSNPDKCLTYHLYEETDRERLAKSDITSIYYPTMISSN